MGSPIPDPESESDIAFLLVHDPLNAPTQPFTLHAGNFQITDGMTLYNARNQCDPFRRTYKVDVTSQTVRDRRQIVFCKFSQKNTHVVPIENLNERVQFEQQGFIGCRALTMVSRPGYSGSPIWDNQLHLYGMDVRGSTPSDNAYAEDGDITVCLPTAEMYAARQRIDSILQKRLSLM
ncbi:MAG TPA: hypothetical protein VLG69_01840 [Candidatus Andersenbacteria bacterium]|nr:hypothetical protein [Candidatus Andersenbacteria bacterium]